MKHIICFSGGHSSALVAIYVAHKFGKENVVLLNHNINPKYELPAIKKFKQEVAAYLGLEITYANVNGIVDHNKIPSQFEACKSAGTAITSPTGFAICTAILKTGPFLEWLNLNYLPYSTLFEEKKDCIIYYGFDANEKERITRRVSIMGAIGYKTAYPIAFDELTITDTNQIGISRPSTYNIFKHANCIGCLKAGLLHWFVVYCLFPDIYCEGKDLEEHCDYTINTVIRDGVKTPISLEELEQIYQALKEFGVEPTEHQSDKKFGRMLRKFQIEALNINKPCECTD